MSAMSLQAKKPPFEKDLIKTHILQDVKPSTKTQNTTERKKTPAPKDRTWSDNMYGGWSRYDVYGDFLDIFGFDIEDPTYIYELATSSFLLENNHYICAAAWDGKQVQFISEIYYPSYDVFTIGYRGTLDPMTGEMQLLSNSGYASQETGNISSLTYDKVSGKLFGLNLNGVLYEVSMQDSTSSVIDTIRWQGQSIGYPMTLSASPNGSLFTISSESMRSLSMWRPIWKSEKPWRLACRSSGSPSSSREFRAESSAAVLMMFISLSMNQRSILVSSCIFSGV